MSAGQSGFGSRGRTEEGRKLKIGSQVRLSVCLASSKFGANQFTDKKVFPMKTALSALSLDLFLFDRVFLPLNPALSAGQSGIGAGGRTEKERRLKFGVKVRDAI